MEVKSASQENGGHKNDARSKRDARPIDRAAADLLAAAALGPADAPTVQQTVRQEGDTWARSVTVESTITATPRGTRLSDSEMVDVSFSQAFGPTSVIDLMAARLGRRSGHSSASSAPA